MGSYHVVCMTGFIHLVIIEGTGFVLKTIFSMRKR